MHSSLWQSPAVQKNVELTKKWTTFLEPRKEEDKLKFPDPVHLASEISHHLNKTSEGYVFVSMGTTRGYIDDVRYISNYSTGALGTLITHELYRYGHNVNVVCGPCEQKPSLFSKMTQIQTYDEFASACFKEAEGHCKGAVFAASVLDFVPQTKRPGKIRSSEELRVDFRPTEKVIAKLSNQIQGPRVGFKLESAIAENEAGTVAKQYVNQYGLDMMVVNPLPSIAGSHSSYIFAKSNQSELGLVKRGTTKQDIADAVVRLFS
jgi:phosphopantothenoylcysteine synthetase/decarboxylase